MRQTLIFYYAWFTEHHNLMEIVDSRAPFGNLTNQSNGGNY